MRENNEQFIAVHPGFLTINSKSTDAEIYLNSVPSTFLPSQNRLDIIEQGKDTSYVIKYLKDSNIKVVHVGIDFDNTPAVSTGDMALAAFYQRTPVLDLNTGEIIKVGKDDFGIANYLLQICKRVSTSSLISRLIEETYRLVPHLISEVQAKDFLGSIEIPATEIERIRNDRLSYLDIIVNKSLNFASDAKVHKDMTSVLNMLRDDEDGETIDVVKAPTGTGKTQAAKKLAKHLNKKGKKTVLLTSLVAVVAQYVKGFDDIASYSENINTIEQAANLVATVNSVLKLPICRYMMKSDLLIIDEAEKVFQSLLDDNVKYITNRNKLTILSTIKQAMKDCKKVVFLDADATDAATVKFAKAHANGKQVRCHTIDVNPYKDIKTTIKSYAEVFPRLVESKLLSDKEMFICCDSKQEIDKLLKNAGYVKGDLACPKKALEDGILVIHSANKSDPEQEAFQNNPNKEIGRYKTVIISPCLREGFSITRKHAKTVLVICCNVLQPLSLIQLARRLRPATAIEFAVRGAKEPYRFADYYSTATNVDAEITAEFAVRQDVLLSHIPYTLNLTLTKLGFQIIETEHEEISAEHQILNRLAATDHKHEVVEFMESAPYMSIEEAREKQKSGSYTKLEEYSIKKAQLVDRLNIFHDEVDVQVLNFDNRFNKPLAEAVLDATGGHQSDQHSAPMRKAARVLADILCPFGFTKDKGILFYADADADKKKENCTSSVGLYNQLVEHKDALNVVLNSSCAKLRIADKPLTESVDNKYAASSINAILKAIGFEVKRAGGKHKYYHVWMHRLAETALFGNINKDVKQDDNVVILADFRGKLESLDNVSKANVASTDNAETQIIDTNREPVSAPTCLGKINKNQIAERFTARAGVKLGGGEIMNNVEFRASNVSNTNQATQDVVEANDMVCEKVGDAIPLSEVFESFGGVAYIKPRIIKTRRWLAATGALVDVDVKRKVGDIFSKAC